MADKILLRGDSKANWESVNPVLSDRELVIETDTNKTKIGDGVKTYTQLSYSTNGNKYKSYVANITQEGATEIVVSEVLDEIGITMTSQYAGVGKYILYPSGVDLVLSKTIVRITYTNISEDATSKVEIGARYEYLNNIEISSGLRSPSTGALTLSDNQIHNAKLEIILYE